MPCAQTRIPLGMSALPSSPAGNPEMSSSRVFRGIMRDLEDGRLVPGQILAETSLAGQYGVGRNAVREAMQQLAKQFLTRERSWRAAVVPQPAGPVAAASTGSASVGSAPGR